MQKTTRKKWLCKISGKEKRLEMNNETIAKDILDDTGILVSGTWNSRNYPPNPADSPVLYGNSVLLCKEFREASFLVSWNKFI